jgi:hypothetical protein
MRGKMFDERRTARRHPAEGKARHCPDLTRRFKFKPTLERLEDRLAPTASLSLSVSELCPSVGANRAHRKTSGSHPACSRPGRTRRRLRVGEKHHAPDLANVSRSFRRMRARCCLSAGARCL